MGDTRWGCHHNDLNGFIHLLRAPGFFGCEIRQVGHAESTRFETR